MSGAERWKQGPTEHWITAAWAEGACKALVLLNPDAAAFALEAREPQPENWSKWADPFWILFPCDVDAAAGVSVGCSRAVLQRVGGLALGDPEDADGLAAETYRELISQAMASVGAALQNQSGMQARFAGGVDVAEPSDATLGVEFWFEIDGEQGSIALTPNAAFIDAVLNEESAEEAADGAPTPNVEGPELGEGPADVPRRNLEMLLDLEMEVAVSFGQTEMLLKDVLKLSVGSIVELQCQASDPVEVLVNDTVIARGEVVVVDSNYGVRITDVSSRRERIQSIF